MIGSAKDIIGHVEEFGVLDIIAPDGIGADDAIGKAVRTRSLGP